MSKDKCTPFCHTFSCWYLVFVVVIITTTIHLSPLLSTTQFPPSAEIKNERSSTSTPPHVPLWHGQGQMYAFYPTFSCWYLVVVIIIIIIFHLSPLLCTIQFPPSAEIKNERSSTSTSPTCLCGMSWDKCTPFALHFPVDILSSSSSSSSLSFRFFVLLTL
jgi:hypothetical protein